MPIPQRVVLSTEQNIPTKQTAAALARKVELTLATVDGMRKRENLAHLTALLQRDPSPHNHAAHEAAMVANTAAMARIMIAVEAHPVKERSDLWDKVRATLNGQHFSPLAKKDSKGTV